MGKTKTLTSSTINLLFGTLCLLICFSGAARAQEAKPSPSPAAATPAATPAPTPLSYKASIKIAAKYASTGTAPAARKHFYLTAQQPQSFASLVQKIGPPPSFKEYQRVVKQSGKVADETKVTEFIEQWLKKYNCETVYCRPITMDDVKNIRLFAEAHAEALKIFGKMENGAAESLKWLPNFLPDEIKSRFYEMRAAWLMKAKAEAKVTKEVMTSRTGSAYFTDIAPGKYFITNLLPIETKEGCFLWTAPIEIKATTKREEPSTFTDKSKTKVDPQELAKASPDYSCAKQ